MKLPTKDPKRIPFKKAFGKKCLSYIVQEILEFTESPKFKRFTNKVGTITSTFFYLMSPTISTWVAWRFYWQYGEYYSAEHTFLFIAVAHLQCMSTWCHWNAMYSDPGFVKPEHFKIKGAVYQNEDELTWSGAALKNKKLNPICRKPECKAIKIQNVHHCRSCDKCVYMMDHHCIWINNCVGRGTAKQFALFTFYLAT